MIFYLICRCELLSKIIIFVMKDNTADLCKKQVVVVNCFQKLLSSWWRTAKKWELTSHPCCELLSKIIIFVMKDSQTSNRCIQRNVVNCFQKLLSSWWRTAKQTARFINCLLWIAFKNYYLRDEGQRFNIKSRFASCCELLSKIIIFVMKDSKTVK